MEKIIKLVTATGADDSIKGIGKLFDISEKYPFVEWGILLSKSNMGRARFPSFDWLEKLSLEYYDRTNKINLSAHLCGRWVRELFYEGKTEFFDVLSMGIFKRIQFNFHAQKHPVNEKFLKNAFEECFTKYELIFQFDEVNDHLIAYPILYGIKTFCLYDQSGGAGILPDKWPKAHRYSGYAGGLSPDNVVKELEKIEKVRNGYPIWIDTETKLRSEDDSVFDLNKVTQYLENAKPWVL